MISKGTIRFVKSLQLKKYRKKAQSFLVEGTKSVLELLNAPFEVTHLIGTEAFLIENAKVTTKLNVPLQLVSEKQLSAMGALKTNRSVLAVARCPLNEPITVEDEYVLALDRIKDPGNLGTIVRTADWYGMKKLLCSPDCADFYNPKVIQATMGSFTRVRPYYTHLESLLNQVPAVYGAVMDGEDVHRVDFSKKGIILIGNETNGISSSLLPFISKRVSIPRFGKAESLNASIATAVICDNLRRLT